MNGCTITGCESTSKYNARGMCVTHYSNWHRTGNPVPERKTLLERMTDNIAVEGDCWVWQGATVANGYGRVSAQCDLGGPRVWYAHRAMYTVLVEPIDDDMTIDHLCRNKSCVNPSHLDPVPIGTNLRRANLRHMCANGHLRSEAYRQVSCPLCRAYQRAAA